jgi:cell division protein FtsA
VEPRYEELLNLLQGELRRSGFEDLVAGGVVLTGGSTKMEGLIDLAEEVFHMPVRLGVPQYVAGLEETVTDPVYATGVGLLIYAQQHRFAGSSEYIEAQGLWGRLRNWFAN